MVGSNCSVPIQRVCYPAASISLEMIASWSSFLLVGRAASESEKGLETRVTGTIKRVVPERGFGFITAADGQEYFFHRSGVEASSTFEDLALGQGVTFDVEHSDKGPRAAHVRAD
jgi:CspA family cold shock protein